MLHGKDKSRGVYSSTFRGTFCREKFQQKSFPGTFFDPKITKKFVSKKNFRIFFLNFFSAFWSKDVLVNDLY